MQRLKQRSNGRYFAFGGIGALARSSLQYWGMPATALVRLTLLSTPFWAFACDLPQASSADETDAAFTSEEREAIVGEVSEQTQAMLSPEADGERFAMAEAILLAQGRTPPGMERLHDGRAMRRRHKFRRTMRAFGDIERTVELICFDADDAEQDACDASTVRAEVAVALQGTLEGAHVQGSIDREATWVVLRLSDTQYQIDGTSMTHIETNFDAPVRPMSVSRSVDHDNTYDGVVFDTEAWFAVAGTISLHATGEKTITRDGEERSRTWERTATITFAEDGSASVEIEGEHAFDAPPPPAPDDLAPPPEGEGV